MRRRARFTLLILGLLSVLTHVAGADDVPSAARVSELRITLLSTMLADRGIGEWGFAALVEADGRRILFDTGNRPDTVRINAEALGVDLSDVGEVVLSHNHGDHTGGLLSLRDEWRQRNPDALAVTHVGKGIFWRRPGDEHIRALHDAYLESGGRFVEHQEPREIHPGIWVTGTVPRIHPERNYPVRDGYVVETPGGERPDTIPESLSLVIVTDRGLVVLSGCGHAGLVNILDHAADFTAVPRVHAVVGGFHLARADDDHLAWTAGKLANHGVEQFFGAHCTGLEPVYRFRALTGLERSTSVVGAVGSTFSLTDGIEPGFVAR